MGKSVTDQWVRLGMAIVIIALISLGLYQFSGRANAVAPTVGGIAYRLIFPRHQSKRVAKLTLKVIHRRNTRSGPRFRLPVAATTPPAPRR